MRTAVSALCGFTILASAWLFVMFLILRHPGFEWRAVASLGFVGISALTLATVRLTHPEPILRAAAAAGALVLGAVGVWAMTTNVDEGFVDVISLAFMLQAGLTVGYLLRTPS